MELKYNGENIYFVFISQTLKLLPSYQLLEAITAFVSGCKIIFAFYYTQKINKLRHFPSYFCHEKVFILEKFTNLFAKNLQLAKGFISG